MVQRITARVGRRARKQEDGMSTAEYAVGTVASCGFAGILYKILTSDFGQNMLENLLGWAEDLLPWI